MINYSHQTIDNSDLKAVTKAIKSNFLSQGSMINNFENKLKFILKQRMQLLSLVELQHFI